MDAVKKQLQDLKQKNNISKKLNNNNISFSVLDGCRTDDILPLKWHLFVSYGHWSFLKEGEEGTLVCKYLV
jgi:hypothetical protein